MKVDGVVMSTTVWGIATCSTVKKAERALTDHGIAWSPRDLRAAPPTRADVLRFVAGVGVAALKNTSGGSYRALPESARSWTDDAWIDAFVSDPMLLKRPIIEHDGVTVGVGFKTDAVLAKLR